MANLQEWAYKAAGGGALMSSYSQQEHEALMRLVDEVKDWGLNNAKKTGDYSQLAKQVIDNNGGLPPAEYDALQDQLMNEHKNEYLGPEGEPPDNQTQARKLNEIRQIAEEYDGYASYRDGLAKALLEHKKNPGVSGLSNAFMKDKKSICFNLFDVKVVLLKNRAFIGCAEKLYPAIVISYDRDYIKISE